MMARVLIGVVAIVLLALGVMNAANKAGVLGPRKPVTRVAGDGFALALPAVWHADTGDLSELREGVCKIVAPATTCQAFFIKGLGSPRALAVVAVGPAPAGGPLAMKAALSSDGIEATGPEPVAGLPGAQRYRTAFKKRGRNASLAVTDAIPLAANLLIVQVVAEEAEGRYQSQLIADIETTLEGRAQ